MCDRCPPDAAAGTYYFCEPVHAGPLAPWCLRPAGHDGPKYGGGVDTASLCGRVAVGKGWDVEVPVDAEHMVRPGVVCQRCMQALMGQPKHFSIEGKGTKE